MTNIENFLDKRINGLEIREGIRASILDVSNQLKSTNTDLSLGILIVGDDLASQTFVNVKKKFGESCGIGVNVFKIPYKENGFFRDLLKYFFPNKYEKMNLQIVKKIKNELQEISKKNSSVILQLPLPKNLKKYTDEILENLDPKKDVDNLNHGNFEAPIILALKEVLNYLENVKSFSFSNLTFGVVGLGKVVGMPIKSFLDQNNFKNIVIEEENFLDLKKCDVVISGVGKPFLIKKNDIKENSVLIDYGCSYYDGKMCGDFDASCYEICSFYTPVPGCMGPLVVASLFKNVIKTRL